MTIQTTTATELNVGQIIQTAYWQSTLVGDGQAPSEDQMARGARLLGLVLSGTQARGYFAKTADFVEVTLTAGDYTYDLPVNIVDVSGFAMYIQPGFTDVTQVDGETAVVQVSREDWHLNSAKAAEGAPSTYYLYRSGALAQVRLWPVPTASEAGGVIRFQANRLRADVTDRTATVDMERYWQQWLVYQLAADLAIGAGLPINRVQMLQGKASHELTLVQGIARDGAPVRARLSHRTSWSRR